MNRNCCHDLQKTAPRVKYDGAVLNYPDVTLRLYLVTVELALCRLWMFLHDVQHGVVQRQKEHRRLNFVIKEAAVVQFLQDVTCGWRERGGRYKFA